MEKTEQKTALRVRKRPLKRYPEGQRRELMARAKQRWAEGASVKAVALELGVSAHTLTYWRGVEGISAKRKLQRVQVVRAEPIGRSILAAGPYGLRFELTLDDVANLLRKLR